MILKFIKEFFKYIPPNPININLRGDTIKHSPNYIELRGEAFTPRQIRELISSMNDQAGDNVCLNKSELDEKKLNCMLNIGRV